MAELKGKVLLLNSEGCGTTDSDLGFQILVALFETLPQREDRPAAIIFWNTAVNLLVNDSPLLPHLRSLEAKGVELLAGKLCVSELELTNKIAVGRIVSLGDILDIILYNDVISL
ncbi:hypothetical protein ACFLW6_00390 [Chloroflexota bacterium]